MSSPSNDHRDHRGPSTGPPLGKVSSPPPIGPSSPSNPLNVPKTSRPPSASTNGVPVGSTSLPPISLSPMTASSHSSTSNSIGPTTMSASATEPSRAQSSVALAQALLPSGAPNLYDSLVGWKPRTYVNTIRLLLLLPTGSTSPRHTLRSLYITPLFCRRLDPRLTATHRLAFSPTPPCRACLSIRIRYRCAMQAVSLAIGSR